MAIIPLGFDLTASPVALKTTQFPGPTIIYSRDINEARGLSTAALSFFCHQGHRTVVFTAPHAVARYLDMGLDGIIQHGWDMPLALEALAFRLDQHKKDPTDSAALIVVDDWAAVTAQVEDPETFARELTDISRGHPDFHVIITAEDSSQLPPSVRAASTSTVFLGMQAKQTQLDYRTELDAVRTLERHENNFAHFHTGGRHIVKPLRTEHWD